MKHLYRSSAIAALLLSHQALALDLEVGTGINTYQQGHSGVWYQYNYPHKLQLRSTPFSLGVSWMAGETRLRAEYLYQGFAYSDAISPPDSQYLPGTAGNCVGGTPCTLYRFVGRGNVSGGIFSASRQNTVLGIPFYTEAGLYAYTARWQEDVISVDTGAVWYSCAHRAHAMIGPVLGVGVRYKSLDIGFRYLYSPASGDDVPAIYIGATTLMLKAIF